MHFSCVHCRNEVVNPSSKLTLKGIGKVRRDQTIFYEWKLRNCSSGNDSCTDVDNFNDYVSTPLEWRNLVIKPDKLIGKVT